MSKVNNNGFDFSKYDIGGKNAAANDGRLIGAEAEKAKADGWNIWDGMLKDTTPEKYSDVEYEIEKEVDKIIGGTATNAKKIIVGDKLETNVAESVTKLDSTESKKATSKEGVDDLIKYLTEREEYWTLFKKNLNKLGYKVIQGKGTIDDSWTEYMDLYIRKKDDDPILRKVKEQTDKEFGKSIDEIEGAREVKGANYIINKNGERVDLSWDNPAWLEYGF